MPLADIINKVFQSGKYTGKTYLEVWEANAGYLHFLAGKYGYWHDVVAALESYDKFRMKSPEPVESGEDDDRILGAPSTAYIRLYFREHLIDGFDMSDHIASVYDPLNDNDRVAYFRSLKRRNNLT